MCGFEGCTRTLLAKNLCRAHYYQQYRGEPLRPLRVQFDNTGVCSVTDCSQKADKLMLCAMHYRRQYRHGTLDLQVKSCLMCGTSFEVVISGAFKFCSAKCSRKRIDVTRKDSRSQHPVCWYSRKQWIELILGDPCYICGKPSEHIDHVEPLSKGGSDEWHNLAPLCANHNRSKADKNLLMWMLEGV